MSETLARFSGVWFRAAVVVFALLARSISGVTKIRGEHAGISTRTNCRSGQQKWRGPALACEGILGRFKGLSECHWMPRRA